MNITARILKLFVTAFGLMVMFSLPLSAQTAELDELFTELADMDNNNWQLAESKIWSNWRKSGSPAMDLLLSQGRAAMESGDMGTAIEHFTALTDHAPDFAEGWNARATAYFGAGLFGPSIADIRQTLALNPRHFGALAGLAMIFEQLGYPNDALKAYRAVETIHPHTPNLKDAIERLEQEVGGTEL